MRKLLLSFCFLSPVFISAQINKTFTLSGMNVTNASIAYIPPASGGGIYLAGSMGSVGNIYRDSFIISKLDGSGNYLFGRYHPIQVVRQTMTNTSDNGILCAILGTRSGGPYGLNLIKYNAGLNPIWSRTFPFTGNAEPASRIDIEKVVNPSSGADEYYILCSDGPATGTYSISLTKVSATGTLLWRKRYIQNAPANGDDAPTSLTSYTDRQTGALRIVIAGSKRYYQAGGGEVDYLFYMTVDNNGNIVNPYTRMATVGVEKSYPDVLFDGENLVTTFLLENNGFVPGYTPSTIGFIKTDLNFNPIAANARWITCENYGLSITMSPDNNYIISGTVGRCGPPATDATTPYFLKINRTTLAPIYFKRYNINRDVTGLIGRHITDVSGNNYIPATVTDVTVPQTLIRALVTTSTGNSCGAEDWQINTYEFTPTKDTLRYGIASTTIQAGLPLTTVPVHMTQTDCFNSGKPSQYRMEETAITDENLDIYENHASVMPTLLYGNRQPLT